MKFSGKADFTRRADAKETLRLYGGLAHTRAADIVGARAANRQSMSEDQGPDQVIRESYITLIILARLLRLKVLAHKPLAIAEFGRTVSEACLTAAKAQVQLQALQRAKDAAR